jgi:hypothetical protein
VLFLYGPHWRSVLKVTFGLNLHGLVLQWGCLMNLNQGLLAEGLVGELLELIHKYDETLYMTTVLGCLELVKQQLIIDAMEEDDE